ncbi:MAG: type II toxin-antitoxin system RelE/ParE family toxin [Candidatus Altiarchaeota archaeon]|nr:type II toxin-antitoxin system RelE/ParE family toxin [Candidatus Altiarchaeota archaeon]
MVAVKSVIVAESFEKDLKKIKDSAIKKKLKNQLRKIVKNPEVGKPLKYGLKGERTVRIKPFRLIYALMGSKLVLLRFEHRKGVYEK